MAASPCMPRRGRRMLVDDRGILTRPRRCIQDPLPELQRRNLSDCERQPGRGLVQVAYIAHAPLAALQVALEALSLGVIKSVKRVGAAKSMRVLPQELHAPTPRQSRIRIKPSRILVLIVPSATLSNPATWR